MCKRWGICRDAPCSVKRHQLTFGSALAWFCSSFGMTSFELVPRLTPTPPRDLALASLGHFGVNVLSEIIGA